MSEWKLYNQTRGAIEALLVEIASAQSSIDIECFYLEPDSTGEHFIDTLIEAKKRGIAIRCLFDSAGSINLAGPLLKKITDAGIAIEFFNWLSPWSKKSKKLLYFRNHRRAFIFDKKRVFTGGICIGDKTITWRDTVVMFEGNVVEQAINAFNWMWTHAKKRNIRIHPEPQLTIDGMMYSTQSPLPRQRYLYYQIIRAIRNAQKEIFITTPYFLPDYRIVRLLKKARSNKIRVAVITPKASDHPVVDIGAQTFFEQLLSFGVEIFRYDSMIHTKSIVIDPGTASEWCLIGSMNMDNISLRYNFESGLVTTKPDLISELTEHIHTDIQNSELLTPDVWRKRGILQIIKEWLVWPIRKLL